ncbi:MAG: PAS domain S-box protein [Desulfobacterales bacterium]|nr:PAS domain S-box protein [Desulfobacterales bacterium]
MTIRKGLDTRNPQAEDVQKEFLKKLHWLMLLRVVVITFLLGITILIQLKQTPSYLTPFLIYLYIVIVIIYFLTFIYAFIINRIKNLPFFAYLQIILDIFLITFLIYSTGGKESIFTFMYTISIITASILVYRKGGVLVASVCSILYGGLLDLEFYGIIHPVSGKVFEPRDYQGTDLFYSILMNITAFYLVAFLSSLLSEQARRSRRELQKKQVDFDQLEALNRNIVQSINSGLLTTDLEGKVTFFNKAAEEITGYSFSQVYNSKAEKMFPFLKKPLNSDHPPFRFESEFKREDGDTLYLGFSTSPLRDSRGEELGDILIFQDLTKLKAMEEHIRMVDRLAAVGRLAAGIAHEMRNPLASVSGSIQVLKGELQLDDGNERLMDIAIRETERLNALITDFLLFAKPGLEGKEMVDIAKVINDTLGEFASSPEWNKDIEVYKNLSKDSKVEANPRQLKQVFWNLFINAVQAMPEGGKLKIEVRSQKSEVRSLKYMNSRQQAENNFLEILITDTGCGIPKENMDKIFDPFFTTKEKGAGMGLAIAYRIIESYKGKTVVKSRVGQGTSFIIYLPLASS